MSRIWPKVSARIGASIVHAGSSEPRIGQPKSVPMTFIGLGLLGVGGALAATRLAQAIRLRLPSQILLHNSQSPPRSAPRITDSAGAAWGCSEVVPCLPCEGCGFSRRTRYPLLASGVKATSKVLSANSPVRFQSGPGYSFLVSRNTPPKLISLSSLPRLFYF